VIQIVCVCESVCVCVRHYSLLLCVRLKTLMQHNVCRFDRQKICYIKMMIDRLQLVLTGGQSISASLASYVVRSPFGCVRKVMK